MSVEAVHELLKNSQGDSGLVEALEAALEDEERAVEAFLSAARKRGYEFTADEFLEVVESLPKGSGSEELDESDLESVSGGYGQYQFVVRASTIFSGYRTFLSASSLRGDTVAYNMEEEEEIEGMAK